MGEMRRARQNHSKSATISGGSIGSALAAFAQILPDPYKMLVSLCAPFITALIISVWPSILNYVSQAIKLSLDNRSLNNGIKAMDNFIEKQQYRLDNEILTDEARELISEKLREVQLSRTHHELRIVTRYINPPRS